jgi:hypothetical protein
VRRSAIVETVSRNGRVVETRIVESAGAWEPALIARQEPAEVVAVAEPAADYVSFGTILEAIGLRPHDPKGLRDKRTAMARLAKFLGHDNAAEVTPTKIVDFVEQVLIRECPTDRTAENILKRVKGVFTFAERYKKISKPGWTNPGKGIVHEAEGNGGLKRPQFRDPSKVGTPA